MDEQAEKRRTVPHPPPTSAPSGRGQRVESESETVALRPATPADGDFAYSVHRAAMRPWVEQTYGWDEAWQRQYFRERFDPTMTQIIRCGARDVGLLCVEDEGKALFLAAISLLPAYQGRGIGTALIRRVQERAARRGVPLALRVLQVNPARALYERRGFVVTDQTDTHYQMTWTPGAAEGPG